MLIDFYNGIDGPTLRIEATDAELVSLSRRFKDLEEGRASSIDLSGPRPSEGKTSLKIRIARLERRFRRPEVISASTDEFEWNADELDLARYRGLMAGLLAGRSSRAEYQFLTSPGGITVALVKTPVST